MEKKVHSYMEQWNMVQPGMHIVAGFSGGADSTALLEILWEYQKTHKITLSALHVHHGIRGQEADQDQRFCERFCQERGIGFRIVRADVPKVSKAEGISLEEAGRKVRYQAFLQELGSGVDRIALAHHQNDQAETMLFHLMRGSRLRGLRGMKPVRGSYIRPFLCVTRKEIEDWLVKKKITWVEDSTNQELEYTRNQIRHQVLKPMERIRKGTIQRMAKAAEGLQRLEDFFQAELQKQWEGCVQEKGEGFRIVRAQFQTLHPALQEAMLLQAMERLSKEERKPEAIHVEQVLKLLDGKNGSRLTLPGGCFAVLAYEALLLKKEYKIEKTAIEVFCEPGQEYHYMGADFRLTLENREKNVKIPVNRYTKWFDYDKIKNNVVLRTRRPGDYLEVAPGVHKKLKDYLIDQKVPREDRDQCILLADGAHIIWVTGMRISENYKVTEKTRRILKVQKIEYGGTNDGETPY